MIFFSNISLDSGEVKKVVIMAKVNNTYYHFFQLFKDDVLRLIKSEEGTIKLSCFPENPNQPLTKKPFPVCTTGCDITNLYNIFMQSRALMSDDYLTEVAKAYSGTNIPMTLRDTKEILASYDKYVDYIKDESRFPVDVKFDLLEQPGRIQAFIEENNNRSGLSYISSGINNTLPMAKPTDKVFIKIPSYDEIVLNICSTLEYFPPQPWREESNKYFSDTKKGDVENNDLDIQENELEYYNALCELVKYSMKQEYPDKSIDYCIENNVCALPVKEFLVELALHVARWNWAFTGYISLGVFQDDDGDSDGDEGVGEDSDSDSKGEAETLSSRAYAKATGFEGDELLMGYITTAASTSVFSLCEAIVKLFRWGERKPTSLKLSGTAKYLDLNNFKITANSGTYSSYTVVRDADGYELAPISYITATNSFADYKYLQSLEMRNRILDIPVGLLCLRTYSSGDKQAVAVSIFDIIDTLKTDDKFIRGVSIKNNSLNFDATISPFNGNNAEDFHTLAQIVSSVENSNNHDHVFHTTDKFKQIYLDEGASCKNISYLSILNQFLYSTAVSYNFALVDFDNGDDLKVLSVENGIPISNMINTKYAKSVLPIVLKVAEEYHELEDEGKNPKPYEVLTLFDSFLNGKSSTPQVNVGTPSDTSNQKSMDLFAKEEKVEVAMNTDYKNLAKDLIVELDPSEVAVPLVRTGADGALIRVGYLVQKEINSKRKYVFICPDSLGNRKVGNSNFSILSILFALSIQTYHLATGGLDAANCRYDSLESFKYFTLNLKNIIGDLK